MADLTTKPISRGRAGEWLDRALWTALFLACAVAISKNQADPDFWGHVQYGRDALRDGLPHTATYSYTAEGHRWINHENLSEFAFAAGIDWIGPSGLLAVKCVLGLTVLGLILRGLRRRGAGLLTSFAATMLAAMNLMFFWSLRPQVFSYTLFALLMALVDWCFRDWESDPPAGRGEPWEAGRANRRLRWLWAAAPLFALWANTHGAFVAGYLMFAVYLASRGVEAWVRHGRQAMGAAVHFAAVIIAAGLATALNPYGFELHAWLRRSLSAPRPEIVEWLPPELLSVAWAPLWLMAAVCVAALAASRRKRDYTHLLLLGLTLWQAIEHRRHIPFFTILVGFWMGGHIQSLLDRLGVFRNTDSLGAGLSPAKRRGLGACLRRFHFGGLDTTWAALADPCPSRQLPGIGDAVYRRPGTHGKDRRAVSLVPVCHCRFPSAARRRGSSGGLRRPLRHLLPAGSCRPLFRFRRGRCGRQASLSQSAVAARSTEAGSLSRAAPIWC